MPSFAIPESAQSFVGLNTAPRVDREDNKKQEHDEDGQPMWEVRVASLGEPDGSQGIRVPMPDVLRVTVAGARPQIAPGSSVKFRGLTLRSWRAKDGREGLMYLADAVVTSGDGSSAPTGGPVPGRGQSSAVK